MDRRTTALQIAPSTHPVGPPGGLTGPAWLYLLAASAVAMMLLALRVRLTGTSGHLSLAWDLFLAWIPLPAAWAYHRLLNVPGRPGGWRRLAAFATFAGWLLFFPNSPYLLTQPIHLHPWYGPSANPAPKSLAFLVGGGPFAAAPLWLELLLLVAVAGCGALLTFASARLVHLTVRPRLGRRTAGLLVVTLLLAASFGVALGRFDRFNSWDVVRKPGPVFASVLDHIVNPAAHPAAASCTLVLATLLGFGYFGVLEIGRGEPRRSEPQMHTDEHS